MTQPQFRLQPRHARVRGRCELDAEDISRIEILPTHIDMPFSIRDGPRTSGPTAIVRGQLNRRLETRTEVDRTPKENVGSMRPIRPNEVSLPVGSHRDGRLFDLRLSQGADLREVKILL